MKNVRYVVISLGMLASSSWVGAQELVKVPAGDELRDGVAFWSGHLHRLHLACVDDGELGA